MVIDSQSSIILSFLLALKNCSQSLTHQEQETFKEISKQLKMQPKAWEEDIQPTLLQTIQQNPQLNEFFEYYQEKLGKLATIPQELLAEAGEWKELLVNNAAVSSRGFNSQESAVGYQEQLNNVVIVVGAAEKSEEAVQKLGFLNKLKQMLPE